ncbi:MAG TPA: tail fiber protein [Baekduia sp.]|uniref:phage tail protein n=1 Tax=Baekduia sp. TaxID=2600305 RepID=UPI002D770A12|nr:tail fiber protein [Baekduia sp.]HET6509764.1 tail fiber protein [Baekduia sp.]
MADPFVAEIRVVAFTFAPKGWATCDGQILPLSQNTALFSLLGTTYGGDGRSNFALPDLEGRTAIHRGQGPGLDDYWQGSSGGSETVTLLESEMPQHGHALQADGTDVANQTAATSTRALARSRPGKRYQTDVNANLVAGDPESVYPTGSNAPHDNLPPMLVLKYVIALQGSFPQRP